MKVQLLGGQYDGKEMDVAEPPAARLIMPDLASYGESIFATEASDPPECVPFRTLTYVRQRLRRYPERIVYVYEP